MLPHVLGAVAEFEGAIAEGVLKGLFDDYFHLMQGVLLLVLLLRVTLLWKLTAAVSAFTVCVVAEGIVA